MNDDLNLNRLAEIPDPFEGSTRIPDRPMHPDRWPRSSDRRRVRGVRLAAAVGALLYDAAWVAWVERRPDLTTVSPSRLVFGLAGSLVAAMLALAAATRRGKAGLGETKARVVALAIGSPVLFTMATLLGTPAQAFDARFWGHAAGCVLVSALLATGPLALGALAFRHAFAIVSVWRTAALGLACGALAAATMTLVCPIDNAAHVLVGHGTILVIAGAVGTVLGRRTCRT